MRPLTFCSICKAGRRSRADKSIVGAASESRTAARVGMRNLDWPKGGNGLQRLVAFLATASRGKPAITIFYRLYGER